MAIWPNASDVRQGITYGPNDNDFTGELDVDVEAAIPPVESVLAGVDYGWVQHIGTYVEPDPTYILGSMPGYGPGGSYVGTIYDGNLSIADSSGHGFLNTDYILVQGGGAYIGIDDASLVASGVPFGAHGSAGTLTIPDSSNVLLGIGYGNWLGGSNYDTNGTLDPIVFLGGGDYCLTTSSTAGGAVGNISPSTVMATVNAQGTLALSDVAVSAGGTLSANTVVIPFAI